MEFLVRQATNNQIKYARLSGGPDAQKPRVAYLRRYESDLRLNKDHVKENNEYF